MKKYNYFVLIHETDIPMGISISEQLNFSPLSRLELFNSFFQSHLPAIDNTFSSSSKILSVSISRSFFSTFNKFPIFHKYAFRLDYLNRCYSFLADVDKIPFARVCVEVKGFKIIYVFFAKEVFNE